MPRPPVCEKRDMTARDCRFLSSAALRSAGVGPPSKGAAAP